MFQHRSTWERLALIITILILLFGIQSQVISQDATGPNPVGERPDAPQYALHGPYWVGTQEFVIGDKDRSLPVTVWYPALNPDQADDATAYDAGVGEFMPGPMNLFPGHALVNGLPDTEHGSYPLVIFSHGAGSSRFFTAYFQEHLASYGFVTMAVEHVGSAILEYITVQPDVLEQQNLPEGMVQRALDIQQALTYAETLTGAGGELENMIDMEHIAVSGWSFGGATVLMTAGARFDFDALAAWCKNTAPETSPGYANSCALLNYKDRMAEQMGLDAVPSGLWPSMGDPRIDAVITMAPGRGPVFGVDGLANVTAPSLIFVGTMDAVDGAEDNAYFVHQNIASDMKALVTFANGNHMIYGDCSPSWTAGGFPFCFDAVWDLQRTHDLVNHFSTAFLLDVMKGDKDAAAALSPDAVGFPGIEYKAHGF